MTKRINVEPYLNFKGELCVGLTLDGHIGYDRVLTRSQAMLLRDALNLAIETPDRVDTETDAHARMTDAMRGER